MSRRALALWLSIAACSGADRSSVRQSRGVQQQSTRATTIAIRPGRARIDSLLALGDSVYRQSADSARKVWSLALNAARDSSDSVGIARALTGLGQAARLLGDARASRSLGEQALTLKLRLGLAASELSRSYNALALLAWQEERLADASALLDSAMRTARAAGDSSALAKAVVNAGLVANDLGAFERARTLLERGRDAALALHDSVTVARALTNLSALNIQLGDPVAAVLSIETARRIARALKDSVTELNAVGQLATAYDQLGEPQRSFTLLDSALTMARRQGRRAEEAEDLTLMADLFFDAGDYGHALDYYRRAGVATDSLGQPEERGNILRNEARAHAGLGNLALAEDRAGAARRIHQAGGFAYPELGDLVVLASLAEQRGHAADADRFLRAGRAIAARLRAPIAESRVAIAEAQVAAARHDWARVLHVLDGQPRLFELGGSRGESEAFALEASALDGVGRREAAITAGRRAVAALERVRSNYASDELRTTYASNRGDVYSAQVLRLLRAAHIEEAFQVADGGRGRALIEHLAAARADIERSKSADSGATLAREQLLRRVDALTSRLRQDESRPPRERSIATLAVASAWRDSLIAARSEYEALVARTGSIVSTETGSPSRGVGPTSSGQVIRSLLPGEVLLEYVVTPNQLVIFAITPRGLAVQHVDETEASLASRVRLTRALLQRRDGEASARGVLQALYEILIEPVVASGALKGATRLLVVPHGPLVYLPMAALVDGRSGRYVAQDFSVLRLSTAALLPEFRARGNPMANGGRFEAAVFAPFPDSLPATRDEAAAIRRFIPDARINLGVAANKANLRRALESGAIVHVATHARMNRRNPLFSAIELSPVAQPADPANARIEVHELLGVRVRAPLVFLSGCETALGGAWATGFDTGEDFTTLAQTLLYAGAGNVVATLWRIDDAGASEFASRFYGALRERGVVEALARTQREMLADSRFRSPYYWAAYDATGDGLAVVRANSMTLSDRH